MDQFLGLQFVEAGRYRASKIRQKYPLPLTGSSRLRRVPRFGSRPVGIRAALPFSPLYPHRPVAGNRRATCHGMRTIRSGFHFLLTVIGSLLIAWAAIGIENAYERMLVSALGLLLMEAGIWQVTRSVFPNDRAYRPLRKETDFFVALVRQLNRAAIAAERGTGDASDELARVHAEMHHSVDRMRRLAGQTEEQLGISDPVPLPRRTHTAAL